MPAMAENGDLRDAKLIEREHWVAGPPHELFKQLRGACPVHWTSGVTEFPIAKGFWSVTLYNEVHFFNPNPLKRYSLGTKNKNLKYNADGSLTLYAGAKSPGKDKENNWLPAPEGPFSLYIRAYWPENAILDGTWTPPAVTPNPQAPP